MENRVEKPIFLDASGMRARWFKRVVIAVAVVASVLGVLLVLCLFQAPRFPALAMKTDELANQTERYEETGSPTNIVMARYAGQDDEPAPPDPIAMAAGPARPAVFGFYVPWNQGSLISLKANYRHLSHVLAEWMILGDGEGNVQDAGQPEVAQWAQSVRLPMLLMVTNYRENRWQSEDLGHILPSKERRARLVRNILTAVEKYQLAGVNIDFEQVPVGSRAGLVAFMTELGEPIHAHGRILTEDVPTDDENIRAFDLQELAKVNEYVIPMAYDAHYASGSPGPVAPQNWFSRQLVNIARVLPPGKTVVGLGNYGYDWTLGSRRGAIEVSFEDVISRANQYHGKIEWYEQAENPVLRYEKAGANHEVWFLDATTALNQIRTLRGNGFAGMAFWRLGSEDPRLWRVVENASWPSENLDLQELGALDEIKGVRQYGRGEIIRVAQTRAPGSRRVEVEPNGLARETFDRLPTGDVVVTMGHSDEKLLTLTFDDGPDATYTPRILDILRQKKVPATFFVVGRQAEKSDALLRRMYEEGHSIGNHTYSHINELSSSPSKLQRELSLTQRVIEFSVGHSTTLFRSPYNADSEPRTAEAIRAVLLPQMYGYTTIGELVDPRDWEQRTAEQIVSGVLQDKNLGNVVLLHDGGGDRTPTIEALPRLIDELRAQGYRFVSLEQLADLRRDALMPSLQDEERPWALLEGGALVLRGRVFAVIEVVFRIAIGLTLFRMLFYGILAGIQKRRYGRLMFAPDYKPSISVVIAAYNEETVINKTIRSLLASECPVHEIIVVDDGSVDDTYEVLRAAFECHRRVKILTQPNRGKSAALNRAVREASGEILVALDADTLFTPYTIGKLVRHFSDSRVAAVSGNVKVGNRERLIAGLQSLEYVCGFNLDRRALDVLNAVAVVPGAVGAWRRSFIEAAGGYSNETVAEDTDLTLALRRQGLRIRYDEEAIAYTEVPETLKALAKQRLRWGFGTLQSAWKHRDATFRPRFGTMGLVTLPMIWLYHVMFAAVSPFAEIALMAGLLAGNFQHILLYYAAFLALELLTSGYAFSLEKENPRGLWLLPLQRVIYPPLMFYVALKSSVLALMGRSLRWGASVRHGTAQLKPEFAEAGS